MEGEFCGGPCGGKHHGMWRFMEICMLVLLCGQTCHGYCLAEQLSEFGFAEEEINISTLYRALRKMEQEGLVKSSWEEGEKGPRRRVYAITQRGREELSEWAEALSERRARIDKLLARYRMQPGATDSREDTAEDDFPEFM